MSTHGPKRTRSKLTIGDRDDSTPASQLIRTQDTNEDRQCHHASPPSDDVTNHVDLFLSVVLGPEADTTEQKRPVDGTTSVRMRRRETRVVLHHQELKFSEFAEEVHVFDWSGCDGLDAVTIAAS